MSVGFFAAAVAKQSQHSSKHVQHLNLALVVCYLPLALAALLGGRLRNSSVEQSIGCMVDGSSGLHLHCGCLPPL